MQFDHSKALEAINAPATILSIILAIFLFYYIVDSHDDPRGRSIWKCWICGELDITLQLATALFFLFTASAIVRGCDWLLRHIVNRGGFYPPSSGTEWFLIGGSLTVASMVCLIRVITYPRLGSWPWLIAGVLAFVSAIGTVYLPF